MALNILWLSHLLPYPPIGGVRQRSYNLLKAIAAKNNVTLLALSQNAHQKNKDERKAAVTALGAFCKSVYCYPMLSDRFLCGKAVLLLKSFLTGSCYLFDWVKSNQFKNKLKLLLKENNFDLVYFDTIALACYLKWVAKRPCILNHHNIESQLMFRRAANERFIFNKIYCWQEAIKRLRAEKKYCIKYDLNICVSLLDKQKLKKIVPEIRRVEVVPNGVNIHFFKPCNRKPEPKSLLFIGGMTRFPNRDAMLFFAKEIWPNLKKEIPGVKITVVGRQPPILLQKLAAKDPNFFLTGFVDDVRPYLDATTVYICTIRDGGGTRLKVLDALSAGKAIVSTPLCAEGIDVEDGKEILIAKKPLEFVELIKQIIFDENCRINLGKNGRKLVEAKYDFNAIGKHFNSLMHSMVL
jgi:glycosyltransferase involved in cell wall biosynthesis